MFSVMPSEVKSYTQNEGINLGLTREQVLTTNFGCHTVEAIKTKVDAGTELQDAFKMYQDLDYHQVEGIQLGLTREQVLTTNFGCHTLKAIESIQKRCNRIDIENAYNIVKNKDEKDTAVALQSYLTQTQLSYKPLNQIDHIRVVVNIGGGFGHQRAAITLMESLREKGFAGYYDIQCDDRFGRKIFTKEGGIQTNCENLVSPQLIKMIPEYHSLSPDENGYKEVAGLGKLKISSLPSRLTLDENYRLSPVDLAVCAADDTILNPENKALLYNASAYIGLEPTDWHLGGCFVVGQDEVIEHLPESSEMRLSSNASTQDLEVSSINKSSTEQKILDIISSSRINSQLIYGLHPATRFNIESKQIVESDHLDEVTEMSRIIEANIKFSKKSSKPTLLLLPQEIASDDNFKETLNNEFGPNVYFIDLTKDFIYMNEYIPGNVLVAYTGPLQQPVFDNLLLTSTNLPPVIEGCNSRETCESAGRAYIHGSHKHVPLKVYDTLDSNEQKLHENASLCLEKGDIDKVEMLISYIEKATNNDPLLMEYHANRKQEFLARPDAVTMALDKLGISHDQNHEHTEAKDNGLQTQASKCRKKQKLTFTEEFALNLQNKFRSKDGLGLYLPKRP